MQLHDFYDLTYGERLMVLRSRSNLTMKQLAEMAGTTPSVISKMEKSMPNPNPKLLAKLSFIFGVSVNMLILGLDDPNKNQPLIGLIKNSSEN